jgi:hypothetical protein
MVVLSLAIGKDRYRFEVGTPSQTKRVIGSHKGVRHDVGGLELHRILCPTIMLLLLDQ